jgi:hypothetical protein
MTYQNKKEMIRQEAIDWQIAMSELNLSYGELSIISFHFWKLGRKYGLLKEFKANGII